MATGQETRSPPLAIARSVAALRSHVGQWRAKGETVGLVPTMGALHDGHLALVRAARDGCDKVVVSLFVNPTQFGPNEDLARYPRDEAGDAGLAAGAGADLLFAPTVDEMYPDGFATSVTVDGVSRGLCGDHRPGHFDGVATVVSKLLNQCRADVAYFGEKDYQQLLVVRRLARDLDIGTAIEGVATVREAGGLALSSRNAYLSPAQRGVAVALNATLFAMARNLEAGADVAEQERWGRDALLAAGFDKVDYVAVRDAETLRPVERADRPARVLAAAHLGGTRLIDNVPVAPRR